MRTVFIVIFILFVSYSRADENMQLFDTCPQGAICVQMDINLGELNRSQVVHVESPYGSYSNYTLKVKGKLNGQPEKVHRIKYRSFTDGIECNDFGQGSVAVRGFSADYNPLLFTSSGIIEITNNALQVGCKDCVKLYTKKNNKLFRTVLTPGWDMTLVGYRDAHITYTKDGTILLTEPNRCIVLSDNALFKLVNKEECVEADVVRHYKKGAYGLQPKDAEWILDLKESKYFAFIQQGACT